MSTSNAVSRWETRSYWGHNNKTRWCTWHPRCSTGGSNIGPIFYLTPSGDQMLRSEMIVKQSDTKNWFRPHIVFTTLTQNRGCNLIKRLILFTPPWYRKEPCVENNCTLLKPNALTNRNALRESEIFNRCSIALWEGLDYHAASLTVPFYADIGS